MNADLFNSICERYIGNPGDVDPDDIPAISYIARHHSNNQFIWYLQHGIGLIPAGFTAIQAQSGLFECDDGFQIENPFRHKNSQTHCAALQQIDLFAINAGFKVFGLGSWSYVDRLVAPTETDAVLLSGFVTVLEHESL